MTKCIIKSDSQKLEWYENEIRKISKEILDLKLSRPALRALINNSIYTKSALKKKSKEELAAFHGIGPSALEKILLLQK